MRNHHCKVKDMMVQEEKVKKLASQVYLMFNDCDVNDGEVCCRE